MMNLSVFGLSVTALSDLVPLLLLLTPLWPLLIIPMLRGRPFGALWLSAPIPGLLLALLASGDASVDQLALDQLLLGTLWWLDETRQVFLLLTSVLWLLAGCYARGYLSADAHGRRFEYFWLLSLSGNLLLIIAEDVASFYTGFTLMSLMAYGLVVHSQTPEAQKAGRLYMQMAVLGEGLLLAGLLGLAALAPEPMISQLPLLLAQTGQENGILMLCLLLGFGVKAGLPLLHIWLPLAHPVAPTPASAVLSGAMVKAGILGWLLTLPLGDVQWPDIGFGLIVAGITAAIGAGVIGSLQFKAKAVLAYSSISQLGMMTALIGAGLSDASLWPWLLPGLLLFSVHHGLNKAALFLAVGLCERLPRIVSPWLHGSFVLLVLIPPLALVGWLNSGMLSKTLVKSALYQQGEETLAFWLTFAALSTALLMLRYLWLIAHQRRQSAAGTQSMTADGGMILPWLTLILPWLTLIMLGLSLPWLIQLSPVAISGVTFRWPDAAGSFSLLWPPLLALLIAGAAMTLARRYPRWSDWTPPMGDLLTVYQIVWRTLCQVINPLIHAVTARSKRLHQGSVSLLKRSGIQKQFRASPRWEWAGRREVTLIFTLLLAILTGLMLIAPF